MEGVRCETHPFLNIKRTNMDKLRGKNVTFFMQDELDEYSINLEMWNMALGELEKQTGKTIKEALNNLIKQ